MDSTFTRSLYVGRRAVALAGRRHLPAVIRGVPWLDGDEAAAAGRDHRAVLADHAADVQAGRVGRAAAEAGERGRVALLQADAGVGIRRHALARPVVSRSSRSTISSSSRELTGLVMKALAPSA